MGLGSACYLTVWSLWLTRALLADSGEPPCKRLCVEEEVEEAPLPVLSPGIVQDVFMGAQAAGDEEPQPGPSREGLNPSEWGELLGVYSQGLDQEPIVLHCFETLEDSEEDAD